jgi:hypothetical protein
MKGILTKTTKSDGDYYWAIVYKEGCKIEKISIHPNCWIDVSLQNKEVEFELTEDFFAKIITKGFSKYPTGIHPIKEARLEAEERFRKAKEIKVESPFKDAREAAIKYIEKGKQSKEFPTIEMEIKNELEKCKKSPYYFYTTYWLINGRPATTLLSEEEFNKYFR